MVLLGSSHKESWGGGRVAKRVGSSTSLSTSPSSSTNNMLIVHSICACMRNVAVMLDSWQHASCGCVPSLLSGATTLAELGIVGGTLLSTVVWLSAGHYPSYWYLLEEQGETMESQVVVSSCWGWASQIFCIALLHSINCCSNCSKLQLVRKSGCIPFQSGLGQHQIVWCVNAIVKVIDNSIQ